MLKSELKNPKTIKISSMLNGILFTKNQKPLLNPELKLFYLNSLSEILPLNISLTEISSVLVESPMMIYKELPELSEESFKLLLTVLNLLSQETVVNSKKFNSVLKDIISSLNALNLNLLPLFLEEELNNSSWKLKDLLTMLL